MTNEEAIDVLEHNYPSSCFTDLCEAVEIAIKALSAQPEPIWGLHASVNRPLGDLEIVPRLREIQKQIGGSYAIDRAIEIIEAVAGRRIDEQTD